MHERFKSVGEGVLTMLIQVVKVNACDSDAFNIASELVTLSELSGDKSSSFSQRSIGHFSRLHHFSVLHPFAEWRWSEESTYSAEQFRVAGNCDQLPSMLP